MSEVRIHLNGFARVVCARCKTELKGPVASTCEVCKESLGVTGIISLGPGGGGGGSQKPATVLGSSGSYSKAPEEKYAWTCVGAGGGQCSTPK